MDLHIYHHFPGNGVPSWAVDFGKKLDLVISNQEKIMSALDNLKAVVVSLKQVVIDEVADIEAALAKIAASSGADDPAVVQAVADIQASVDTMKAEHAKANVPPVLPAP